MKYYYNLEYYNKKVILKCNLNFLQPLLRSSESHDPSEIIVICKFGAQEILNATKQLCRLLFLYMV